MLPRLGLRAPLRIAALTAVVAGLALPATALADSGSVTNVANAGGGRVQATFTATSDYCGPSGYCGFFSYARMVESFETCEIGFGRAIWVAGDARTSAGTQSETATFATFDSRPFKICLFLVQADDREYPVAEAVFDPRGLPAAPQAPQQQQDPVQAPGTPVSTTVPSLRVRRAATLRAATARSRVRTALSRRYGRAYRKGKAKRMTCKRASRTSIRCRVQWRHKRSRYRGTVTATSTLTAGVRVRVQVKRTRLR